MILKMILLLLCFLPFSAADLVWKPEGNRCQKHTDCFYYTDHEDRLDGKRGKKNKLKLFKDIPLNRDSLYCSCLNKCAKLIDYDLESLDLFKEGYSGDDYLGRDNPGINRIQYRAGLAGERYIQGKLIGLKSRGTSAYEQLFMHVPENSYISFDPNPRAYKCPSGHYSEGTFFQTLSKDREFGFRSFVKKLEHISLEHPTLAPWEVDANVDFMNYDDHCMDRLVQDYFEGHLYCPHCFTPTCNGKTFVYNHRSVQWFNKVDFYRHWCGPYYKVKSSNIEYWHTDRKYLQRNRGDNKYENLLDNAYDIRPRHITKDVFGSSFKCAKCNGIVTTDGRCLRIPDPTKTTRVIFNNQMQDFERCPRGKYPSYLESYEKDGSCTDCKDFNERLAVIDGKIFCMYVYRVSYFAGGPLVPGYGYSKAKELQILKNARLERVTGENLYKAVCDDSLDNYVVLQGFHPRTYELLDHESLNAEERAFLEQKGIDKSCASDCPSACRETDTPNALFNYHKDRINSLDFSKAIGDRCNEGEYLGYYYDSERKSCVRSAVDETVVGVGVDAVIAPCLAGTMSIDNVCVTCGTGGAKDYVYNPSRNRCERCEYFKFIPFEYSGFVVGTVVGTGIHSKCVDNCPDGYGFDVTVDSCAKCSGQKTSHSSTYSYEAGECIQNVQVGCQDCPNGYYYNPDGVWEPSRIACTPCSTGGTGTIRHRHPQDDGCFHCSRGTFSKVANRCDSEDSRSLFYDNPGRVCELCPSGYYQNENDKNACDKIPANKFLDSALNPSEGTGGITIRDPILGVDIRHIKYTDYEGDDNLVGAVTESGKRQTLLSVDFSGATHVEGLLFNDLTSVSLPDTKTIGDDAFYANRITSLDLGSVETIGDYAFADMVMEVYNKVMHAACATGNTITDLDACVRAADHLFGTYKGVHDAERMDIPPGCSFSGPDVHFNTAPSTATSYPSGWDGALCFVTVVKAIHTRCIGSNTISTASACKKAADSLGFAFYEDYYPDTTPFGCGYSGGNAHFNSNGDSTVTTYPLNWGADRGSLCAPKGVPIHLDIPGTVKEIGKHAFRNWNIVTLQFKPTHRYIILKSMDSVCIHGHSMNRNECVQAADSLGFSFHEDHFPDTTPYGCGFSGDDVHFNSNEDSTATTYPLNWGEDRGSLCTSQIIKIKHTGCDERITDKDTCQRAADILQGNFYEDYYPDTPYGCGYSGGDIHFNSNSESNETAYPLNWGEDRGFICLDKDHPGEYNVKTIQADAFRNNGIKFVNLPDSILSIGARAFKYNPIEYVNIGHLQHVGFKAFDPLLELNINMVDITDNAFYEVGLEYLTLGSRVRRIGEHTFGNNQLQDVTILNGTESIDVSAFRNNRLGSITIPSSVQSIGKSAFAHNNISTLNLHHGIQIIDDHAFYNNTIKSVTIPGSVEHIGYAAFSRSNIEELIIEEGVKTIGDFAFAHNRIARVVLPSTLTHVGRSAFANNLIEDIELAEVKEIGNFSFFNHRLPTKSILTIPSSVQTIGKYAFGANVAPQIYVRQRGFPEYIHPDAFDHWAYVAQTNVTHEVCQADTFMSVIFQRVQEISANAFKDCEYIRYVHLPSGIQVGTGAFLNNDIYHLDTETHELQLTQDMFDSKVHIISYGTLEVEAQVKDVWSVYIPNTVHTIQENAFHNKQIERIQIPTSVTVVGEKAFRQNIIVEVEIQGNASVGASAFSNNKITSLNLGHTHTIGRWAFGKNHITELISGSVRQIGDSAFYDNRLTSLTLGNSLESIDRWAFGQNHLTELIIPDSVRQIGDNAFYNNSLTTIFLGNSLESIGKWAFDENTIDAVVLPDSVVSVGKSAFRRNAIVHLSLGSVQRIGDFAFIGNSITDISFPDNVTIGYKAFSENPIDHVSFNGTYTIDPTAFDQLEFIPEGTTHIADSAYSNRGLTSIYIPKSVVSIGENAFSSNRLTSVDLSNVHTVGKWAFWGNQIQSLTMPAARTIDTGAFADNQLETLTIGASIETIGRLAFRSNKITEVTLPDGVVVGENAFAYNQIAELTLPDNAVIGQKAFQNNGMTSLTIGQSNTIGELAFHYNYIEILTVPESAVVENGAFFVNTIKELSIQTRAISDSVFKHNQISELSLPDNVTVGWKAFSENPLFKGSVTFQGSYTVDPESFDGMAFISTGVDTVEDDQYRDLGLTSIRIPESVKTIGRHAFSGNDLVDVNISTVTSVGDYAFFNSSIRSVVLGETLVGKFAFDQNIINALTIPESTFIDAYAFRNNIIEDLTIGPGVHFGNDSFRNNSLTTLSFPDNTTIMKGAFSGNPLTRVEFQGTYTVDPEAFDGIGIVPHGTVHIQDDQFAGKGLTHIYIPNTVETIGARAFSQNNLQSVTIPDSVRSIGTMAFAQNSIDTLHLGAVETVGDSAFQHNQIAELTIPGSTIGEHAFADNMITSLTLGSVITIGASAFRQHALAELVIPDTVVSIGAHAFATTLTPNIATLDLGAVVTIGAYAFAGNSFSSVVIPTSLQSLGEGMGGTHICTESTTPLKVACQCVGTPCETNDICDGSCIAPDTCDVEIFRSQGCCHTNNAFCEECAYYLSCNA